MISGIVSGRYVNVIGGGPAYISKSYNSNTFMQGDMRYDIESQCIKVWDGQTWQTLYGSPGTVELNNEAQALLEWVHNKMVEEYRLAALAEKHPTVADALEAVKKAEEQVKIVAALVQE